MERMNVEIEGSHGEQWLSIGVNTKNADWVRDWTVIGGILVDAPGPSWQAGRLPGRWMRHSDENRF